MNNHLFDGLLSPVTREKTLGLIVAVADKIDLEILFEKIAPYFEHHFEQCKMILLKIAENKGEKVLRFAGDLKIMAYPYADELFRNLGDYLNVNKKLNQVLIQEIIAEVEDVIENRIKLFPQVIGERSDEEIYGEDQCSKL